MGVKDLWGILSPTCERKPIWELQGETIAVDLSAWICDSSTVAEHSSQRNMYLRNLFFRTSYLLLLGVQPIFVLEGKAPILKHDTIEKRQVAQAKTAGRNVKAATTGNDGSRRRLKGLQTQCATLLSSMGLKCIQGDGEAEAFCARLNQSRIVNGVVTQDSDVFLYGAVTVYRHFNTSSAGGGSVDTYDMKQIASRLGLNRNHMIALALLCGCDYSKGVPGVGKESALKFLQSVPDDLILDRIRDWRKNSFLDDIDVKKDKSILPELKAEVQIRSKALEHPGFPSEDVIQEFLQTNQTCLKAMKFVWSKPNINQFIKIADVKLSWDSTYSLEKILPLLSRWHLLHPDFSLTPELILNAKTTKGVKGYVVKWQEFEVTTEEPQCLLEERYPHLVEAFISTKKKGKRTANKIKENVENIPPKTKTHRRVKNPAKISLEVDVQEFGTKREIGNEQQTLHVENTDNLSNKKIIKTKKNQVRKGSKTVRENSKASEVNKKISQNKAIAKDLKVKKAATDTRHYFKNKINETLEIPLTKETFEESLELLSTSINSMSITSENNETKLASKRSFKNLYMNSIVVDDIEYPTNISSKRGPPKFGCMDYSMKASEKLDCQNEGNSDVQDNYGSFHLEEDDIFNYSFNTACRLMNNAEPTAKIKLPSKFVETSPLVENLDFSDVKESLVSITHESLKSEGKIQSEREMDRSDFQMSVNISDIDTDQAEELKESKNLNTDLIEQNVEESFCSFESDLRWVDENHIRCTSFLEDPPISMDISNCGWPESPLRERYKTNISLISGDSRNNSEVKPLRSRCNTAWITSSPIVKANPTLLSRPDRQYYSRNYIDEIRNNQNLDSKQTIQSQKARCMFPKHELMDTKNIVHKEINVSQLHETNNVEVQRMSNDKIMDINSPERIRPSLSFDMRDFDCNETGDLSEIIENIVGSKG